MIVCVEVLRPSQPNGVMSSAVSLPNHTFNFVADAVPCWRNVASVWERFCGGVCRSRSFAVTWCAGLEELWVGLTFRSSSGDLLTVVGELAVAGYCAAGCVPGCRAGRC